MDNGKIRLIKLLLYFPTGVVNSLKVGFTISVFGNGMAPSSIFLGILWDWFICQTTCGFQNIMVKAAKAASLCNNA